MKRNIRIFGAGLMAGVLGVLFLGEPIGAAIMRTGMKVRNAGQAVVEYETGMQPAQRFVEDVPASATSQRRVRR